MEDRVAALAQSSRAWMCSTAGRQQGSQRATCRSNSPRKGVGQLDMQGSTSLQAHTATTKGSAPSQPWCQSWG
ncbi:hypothetical protein HaLaN_04275, partial [Haematococcus lacustris]